MNKLILIVMIVIILIATAVGVLMWSKTLNTTTIEGMKIQILTQGTGPEVKTEDRVTVNYVGTLIDGTEFDSSYKRNTPFTFTVGAGKAIKGWDLGVMGMKVGEKRKLTIPPELAYGPSGAGKIIPPNATLIFEIELISINR